MSRISWQKSSYSGNASNCVELGAEGPTTIHLRESDDPATILTTTPARIAALLTAARTDKLSRVAM